MKDGTILEGEFKNGKLHGRGKQTSPDGLEKKKKGADHNYTHSTVIISQSC